MTRRNAQHALLRYSQYNLVNQEYFSKLREILNKLPGKTRGITNWKKKKRWDYILPTEKKKDGITTWRMSVTSLVAHWLRLQALNAGGPGFNPWSRN